MQGAAAAGGGVATLLAMIAHKLDVWVWISVVLSVGVTASLTVTIVVAGKQLASVGLLAKCCSEKSSTDASPISD